MDWLGQGQPDLCQVLKRRVDENITDVLSTIRFASHYSFDEAARRWKEKDVEGSFMVIRRKGDPKFQMIMLNKTGPGDYKYDITITLEFEKKDKNLIFFRDPGRSVQGIWSPFEDQLDEAYKSILEAQKQLIAESQSKALKDLLDIKDEGQHHALAGPDYPPEPYSAHSQTSHLSQPVISLLAGAQSQPTAGAPMPQASVRRTPAQSISSSAPTYKTEEVKEPILKPEFFSNGVTFSESSSTNYSREQLRNVIMTLAQNDAFLDTIAQALRL